MTTFALIGIFQERENYGAHTWDGTGKCPQAWKYKGSSEKFLGNLTDEEIATLGTDGINRMSVRVGVPFEEFNDYFESYLMDYTLVHVDSELVRKVSALIPGYLDDPYGYMGIAVDLGVTEYEVQQAMAILQEDQS